MHLRKKSKGGALLTALFIMTLVAIVATAMSTRLQLDIYRTRLLIIHDKLYLASQAVTFWALSELNNKKIKWPKPDKQGMVAKYPDNLSGLYDQVMLSGGIYDLQARFNLNNLADKKQTITFTNLIKQTYSKINNEDAMSLALATRDWLQEYDLSRGKDDYSAYYLSQNPAYYPSHQLMSSSSEFRLIKGVDASIYQAIEPFITVLPETTKININTASAQVIKSLGNGIGDAQVNELIQARGENGIPDMNDVAELIKKIDLPADQITIESQYYLSVAYANTDEFNIALYTLLKRSKNKPGKLSVSIIRERINMY